MIDLTVPIYVTWNSKNKKYYENIGYTFSKFGDKFEVKLEDLTKSSKANVSVICDYCGETVVKSYQTYVKQHHEKYGDACKNCQYKKAQLLNMDKYGVDNPAKTKEVKDKIKQSSIDRYGVDNPSKSPEVITKIKETFISKYGNVNIFENESVREKSNKTLMDRYGVDNVFKSLEVQQKIRETNMAKYGVDIPSKSKEIKVKTKYTFIQKYGSYYTQTEEYKERVLKTNLEKYGYEYTLQVPEIREKIVRSMCENNSCPTSRQQKKIHEILSSRFTFCELNYPVGTCFLDCAIESTGVMIDVEYDGNYWHQDKQRDRRRDEFVKSQGYKILRIKRDRKMPTLEEMMDKISELTNTDKKYCEIVV